MMRSRDWEGIFRGVKNMFDPSPRIGVPGDYFVEPAFVGTRRGPRLTRPDRGSLRA